MEEKIGWINCLLDEVIIEMKNGSSSKQFNEKIGFPITRIETIWNETIDLNRVKYIVENDTDLIEKYSLKYGDILLSHINSDAHLGKTAIFKNQCKILIHGINLLLLRPNCLINSDFLNYQFKFLRIQGKFIEVAQRAVNQSSINQRKLKKFEIILPPLPEQRAIVSKIELLFSELDNGIANLKLAQAQLKVYRQAVLKKAFEGELTKKWRKLNSDGESANKLLGLILEKKKTQWENDQLGKFERTGKKPKDNFWKLKYKEPCSPDTANLLDLPKSWSWVSPEQITSWDDPYALAIGPFGSNLKVSDYTSEGIPLVFVRNIRSGVFDNENTKYVSKTKAEELRPHWINSLDVLITKMGEPPGDAYLYPVGHPLAIITADCIKFRLCTLLDNPIYFVHVINSSVVRSQISSITLGVAQKKISLERFKTIALPLPPAEEQKAIVQEIETRLSVCDKIEQDIKENLEKAEALRQSILKKAFEGKLLNERELAEVRGAEDWEPAEVLLERIKTEKNTNRKSA